MTPKLYLLLIKTLPRHVNDRAPKLEGARLAEIRRLLGPESRPVMAWDSGVAVAFLSSKPAKEMTAPIVQAVGSLHQVTVMELGQDFAQFGSEREMEFLEQVRSLASPSIRR